ncbi:hypothetical protein Tco_0717987, partial [Tanacetum coccineum]
IKTFDFQGLKSSVVSLQATAISQDQHLAAWAKSSTSMAWNLGPRLTTIESSQAEIISEISSFKSDTSEIKSMMTEIYQAFKWEHVTIEDDTEKAESDKAKEEPTRAVPISTVIPITRPNPEVTLIKSSSRPPLTDPILEIPVPQQTTPVTQREGKGIATEEQLKSITNKLTSASKVIHEDPDEPIRDLHIFVSEKWLKKIGLDLKTIVSAQAGEKFKKAKDVEHQVLKREHSQKVYSTFKFSDFEVTELDELGRKRKHMELAPEIKVLGLECNRSLPEGVPFVNNIVIEEPKPSKDGMKFTRLE